MRFNTTVLAAFTALCVAIGVFWLSLSFFQSEEEAKARGRLSLYHSTVRSELERFSHLTYVLARDTHVIDTATGGATGRLDRRLAAFAAQSGLDAIYLMRPDGTTIAASNAGRPDSFVGQDYAFRPYFQAAREGAQGRFYGIGATTGLPGYFIADAVRDAEGGLAGVIAIKLDLTDLEDAWRAAGEQVFLANRDGIVLLSSDPRWRYRSLRDLSPDQRARIAQDRQFPGQDLASLDWEPRDDARAVIDGSERIHLSASVAPHDWVLHYFADDNAAVTRSLLLTGLVMLLAGAGFLVSQVRRMQRIGAALRRSEAEEAQLREANERLAVEIDERRTAERRLKRTQDELERASRLAALGQLAASVTHELGQPIAAMRNHLAAAEIGGQPAVRFIPRITGIVDRMEGITRQLKFFARNDREEFGPVDLEVVVQAALSLVAPNISNVGATTSVDAPDQPVIVRGNQLRLEQVLTNVLRNAVDAVENCAERRIDIMLGQGHDIGWVEVHDTGHGLGQARLDELQEPFVTTRESGRGMGLGLAISANIVKAHQGRFSADNLARGGAMFRIEIPQQGMDKDLSAA
ncbi:MAG: cache domain-containing protein [Salibaculum sp.]|uniref:sensor histidine kinase n=1 Tax=Salibaculum sp. TaxID=2855480 RepID=UPI00287015AF|nr:cache domain-containing protein [Salibaculum sp.]MDR9428541.1 cache domain-containing protein [Salibaculum sp.]MDR9481898.1 cache domain-containing protein [Salibaculum sp.]